MSRAGVQSALSIASKPGKYGGIKKSSIDKMGFLTDYFTAKNRADVATKDAFKGEANLLRQESGRAENAMTKGLLGMQKNLKDSIGGAGGRGANIAAAIQGGLSGLAMMNDPITQALQKLEGLGAEQRAALSANALSAQQVVDNNLKAAYDVANDKYLSDRTFQGTALTAAAGLEGQIYAADQALRAARVGYNNNGGNPVVDPSKPVVDVSKILSGGNVRPGYYNTTREKNNRKGILAGSGGGHYSY